MKQYFFNDTETTGLESKPGRHEIVQLGAILTNDRTIIDSISIKSKPENWKAINSEALRVNHLTREILESYSDPAIEFDRMYSMLIKHKNPKNKYIMAGQNVKFDKRFVKLWWERWSNPSKHMAFDEMFDPTEVLDLMEITKPLKELGILVVDNVKLGTVASALCIQPIGELHDAMTDIDLTYRTVFDLVDRINSLNNEMLQEKFKKFLSIKYQR